MGEILFIIGASGSGKTTLAKALEERANSRFVSAYYFDDCGIPAVEKMIEDHGSPENWQRYETHEWIKRIHLEQLIKTVILEGSFNPEFAVEKMDELNIKNYTIICLHATRDIREKRLITERNQPELVTDDMENFASFLRKKTLELDGQVIDTSTKSVFDIIKDVEIFANLA